ncbi:MAG: hypothetical protein SWH68_11360 [Thermodesulfobacteriota bacterium]|nr:hypothetical protein [Thermodesulfobacteriota bacterium]
MPERSLLPGGSGEVEKQMTTDGFSIDFEWLSREYGSRLERATLAEIGIMAGGVYLTELEDLKSRTIRTRVRLSAYDFALWLAGNWWRLCFEPPKEGLDWQLSHSTTSIGGGYVWPNIIFASDGGRVMLQATPASLQGHGIRYLSGFAHFVPVSEFESKSAGFIEAVLEATMQAGVENTELGCIWNEVQKERSDPDLAGKRKLEALLGFDPGETSPDLLEALMRAGQRYGIEAVQEIAAAFEEGSVSLLDRLWESIRNQAVTLKLPNCSELRSSVEKTMRRALMPWQKAEEAAGLARKSWSVNNGPLSNARFAGIFQVPQDFITAGEDYPDLPVHAGLRNGGGHAEFKAFLSRRPVTSRRFALARLIGDHLTARKKDYLLPATGVYTQRQKFQRAFAQEFLCPFMALREFLGKDRPDDEAIEEAASHFQVSPLLIRSALVNKGILKRETLS